MIYADSHERVSAGHSFWSEAISACGLMRFFLRKRFGQRSSEQLRRSYGSILPSVFISLCLLLSSYVSVSHKPTEALTLFKNKVCDYNFIIKLLLSLWQKLILILLSLLDSPFNILSITNSSPGRCSTFSLSDVTFPFLLFTLACQNKWTFEINLN